MATEDVDRAVELDSRVRTLEDAYKRSFIEFGLILQEMQDRELWRHLDDVTGHPYNSFDAWLLRAAPHSRRNCYYALKAVRELKDIPVDDLVEIPRCNLALLTSLSTAVRTEPEVIAAAKCLPEKDFLAKIQSDHPAQHVEAKRKLVFRLEETAEMVILECLDQVGELLDIHDREGQLEMLCANWVAERVK